MITTTTEKAETFGQRLRRLRLERSLSQSELAEAAGTDQAAISRYERGAGMPKNGQLEALGRALGVELDAEEAPAPDESLALQMSVLMLTRFQKLSTMNQELLLSIAALLGSRE